MSNFKLNLPTDIPWKRICVTEDMIDRTVCDDRLPAKWQTSLALFEYRPDDEYQLFPDYNITYLKATATITGYQPLDSEIQGNIDWDGVDVSTIPGLTDLLNSYNPCHGAILQVVVGPKDKKPKIPLKDYPFFMDFEPKKRELYELATDTREKQSRSIESLNITKSAGSTQSMEILDVDMGGGGFGANASYAGTGGGFNYTAPNGQWGTKRLNADESLSSRSTDSAQEKRESFSFSTQISQMYHLLDSYHIATNRVVFFIQPRPHTLEEPSGFVRGPRPVEGIQEFFMVVAQPKDQDDFCVSLRLDTSHLTKTPIMDFDRKIQQSDVALAKANLPTKQDTFVERKVRWHVSYGLFGTDDINYKHYKKTIVDNEVYNVPVGYSIDGFSNLIDTSTANAFSTVNQAADAKSLTLHAEATSHIWFKDEGSGACIDNCPPDTLDERPARAERQVQVNLISDLPTQQIGEQEVLMITTRGLCCCAKDNEFKPSDDLVVDIRPIPKEFQTLESLSGLSMSSYLAQSAKSKIGSEEKCTTKNDGANYDAKFRIRQVNELSDWVRAETLKSLNNPTLKIQKYIDTDFFIKQLELSLIRFDEGRKKVNSGVSGKVPKEVIKKLEKHFDKPIKEISMRDVLSIRNEKLAKITGMKFDQVRDLKLQSLGVKLSPKKKNYKKQSIKKR